MDDEEGKRNIDDMLAVREGARFTSRGMLWKAQRVSKNCGGTVATTIVGIDELVCEDVGSKHKDATPSDKNTDTEAKLAETCVVDIMMPERLVWAVPWLTALRTQLNGAETAQEKIKWKSSRMKADHWAQMVAAEELLSAQSARVESFEHDLSLEVGKRQKLLVDRRETSETAGRQQTEDRETP